MTYKSCENLISKSIPSTTHFSPNPNIIIIKQKQNTKSKIKKCKEKDIITPKTHIIFYKQPICKKLPFNVL